ncbi:MAG: TonB family protein [Gemmatimonadetes bacterium]|nr:TonB family protein [Gemmatimonadota bacterium]
MGLSTTAARRGPPHANYPDIVTLGISMLHPFISTRALRAGYLGSMTFSVAAHTTLLVVAIAPSHVSLSYTVAAADHGYVTEHVRFIETAAAPAARHAERAKSRDKAKEATLGALPAFGLSELDAMTVGDVTPNIPDVDFTSKLTDSLDFAGPTVVEAVGRLIRRPSAAMASGAYAPDMVEKIVTPLPQNPRPDYPRSLMAAGIEGDFVVHFVVDSTGRVEKQSVQFPENAHSLFVDAVRRSLLRSRYLPAVLAGRRVAQLVAQEFVFRIER